ncbi:hypothetical protein NM897_16810 (plasmid) [Planococcus maritimus]|uniref:hypothetical protein n=1 Tax=Planococcus maritimus TaxID=192421 RepID=UPI0031397CE5
MKFFYWNLSDREKFVRSLWTGVLVLVFLYFAAYMYEGGSFVKLYLPIIVTIVMLISLVFKYRKYKKVA